MVVIELAEAPQAGDRADDRGQRRAQIMGDRGEQRGAQSFGLRQDARLVDVLRQLRALDGYGGLIRERVQQAPFVGREERPWRLPIDAEDADRTAARSEWQEQ